MYPFLFSLSPSQQFYITIIDFGRYAYSCPCCTITDEKYLPCMYIQVALFCKMQPRTIKQKKVFTKKKKQKDMNDFEGKFKQR
jgi:hypothetical protein